MAWPLTLMTARPACNGVVTKISSGGNVEWSILLNNGKANGINNLAEYNDTLLVAGYATGDGRDAVVTRLNKSNGKIISAFQISNKAGYNDEASGIEVISNGIAFNVTMQSIYYELSYRPMWFHHFKLNKSAQVTYSSKAEISTGSGLNVEMAKGRTTDDNGFIYLANDTTPSGYSACVKDWSQRANLNGEENFGIMGLFGRITGMDITVERGFVFAGFKNYYQVTSSKNKIQVFKTDRLG